MGVVSGISESYLYEKPPSFFCDIMRSFLAVKVHPNPSIEEFFNAMKNTNGDFKPVRLDQLHFTLKFFGEIDEAKVAELRGVVVEVLKGMEPLSFELFGCGAFPSENYIKVLWLGSKSGEKLVKLGEELQTAFTELGFKKNKFSPHLTLFRVKSKKNKKQIQDVLGSYKKTSFGTVEVTELLLMESELTPQGPIYTVVERFNI